MECHSLRVLRIREEPAPIRRSSATTLENGGVLDLMTALAKMTLLPARRLESIAPEMKRKGRVQIGADADLTIFDPNTII